ncbi:hypothetical protein ACFSNO_27530 [Streptomyces cirratus]
MPRTGRRAQTPHPAGTSRFRATRALHFSNGGGVYVATDTRTGGSVLLKEARPLAGLDEDGADAVARLEREHWALEQLSGLELHPRRSWTTPRATSTGSWRGSTWRASRSPGNS